MFHDQEHTDVSPMFHTQPGRLEVLRLLRACPRAQKLHPNLSLRFYGSAKARLDLIVASMLIWRRSPTFRPTFSAVGQDHTILHLVPVIQGVGMTIPQRSWLLERATGSASWNAYVIGGSEVVVKYQVISSKLGADDVMVVQAH